MGVIKDTKTILSEKKKIRELKRKISDRKATNKVLTKARTGQALTAGDSVRLAAATANKKKRKPAAKRSGRR